MNDPYEYADRERDLNMRKPADDPAKVSEDQALSKKSGPIRPLSAIDLQLKGERETAKARKTSAGRRITKALGGKR